MIMADSLVFGGAKPLAWISACWLSCQLSFDAIRVPLTSCISKVGSARTLGTPNCVSVGPQGAHNHAHDHMRETILQNEAGNYIIVANADKIAVADQQLARLNK